MTITKPERKDKKLYSSTELLGVKFGRDVDKKHASRIRNMIMKDGILEKRNGWRDVAYFKNRSGLPSRINGLYEFEGNIIVHAENSLYRCKKESLEKEFEIDHELIPLKTSLPDEKSTGVVHNKRLWLVSGGKLMVYDGKELKAVYNCEEAYVPTTTKNIAPYGKLNRSYVHESKNILTSKRKNMMIGVNHHAKYILDGKIDKAKEVKINCQTSIGLTDDDRIFKCVGFKNTKRVLGDSLAGALVGDVDEFSKLLSGEKTDYSFCKASESNYFFKRPLRVESLVVTARNGYFVPRMSFGFADGATYDMGYISKDEEIDFTGYVFGKCISSITIYGENTSAELGEIVLMAQESYEGPIQIDYECSCFTNKTSLAGKVTTHLGEELLLLSDYEKLYAVGTPVIISEDEGIELLYNHVSSRNDESNVTVEYSVIEDEPKFRLISQCKTNTGSVVLVLTQENSRLCVSHKDIGAFYLPQSLRITVGGDSEEITALSPLPDCAMGVYKKREAYHVMPSLSEHNVKVYSLSNGCVNFASVGTVGDDTLALSENGVFGTGGFTEGGYYSRSENINTLISSLDLKNACTCVHNGRFYIFVNGQALVGDTRYKSYESTRLDSSYEYEWWMLDNCYARVCANIGGKIYFGREDGTIATFYDGYSDIALKRISLGDITFEDTAIPYKLYLNESLGIKGGSEIYLSNCYSMISYILSATQIDDNHIKLELLHDSFWTDNAEIRVFPEQEIYLKGAGDKIAPATIKELVPLENSVIVSGDLLDLDFRFILSKNQGTKYVLRKQDGYFLIYDDDGEMVSIMQSGNIDMLVADRRDVECEYISSPVSFEGEAYSKTLYQLVFNICAKSRGNVEIGYETNNSLIKKQRAVGDSLDFESFDFSSVAFSADFQKSYILRCFERDFSTVILKISSKNDKPFGISGFSYIYASNGYLKGDR